MGSDAIDILVDANVIETGAFVDERWHRVLQLNAMHAGVSIQCINDGRTNLP